MNKEKIIHNKKIQNMFKYILINSNEVLNARNSLKEASSLAEILKNEVNKPRVRNSIVKMRKCVFVATDEERDLSKITIILRNMAEFKKFILFNKIDPESIRLASNYMQYKKVLKNTYIFKQGEISCHFFGIISGKISIRNEEKKIVNLRIQNDNYFKGKFRINNYREVLETVTEVYESEKTTLSAGEYFGEKGIMEQNPRTANAYALEDTVLFFIDAYPFSHSFGKCMVRAELERKSFLLDHIAPLREITRAKLNSYYNSMNVIIVNKNQPVYIEGSNAEIFFIVYDGVFRLQKKNLFEVENGKVFVSEISKHRTVIKIDKGDFAGVESLFNFQNKEKELVIKPIYDKDYPKYKYSLVAENEYNVIIAINPKIFQLKLRENIYNFLKPILELKGKILENMLIGHKIIKDKMKISYREETVNQLCKNEKAYYQKLCERNVIKIKEIMPIRNSRQEVKLRIIKILNCNVNDNLSNNYVVSSSSNSHSAKSKKFHTNIKYENKHKDGLISQYYNTENYTGSTEDSFLNIKKQLLGNISDSHSPTNRKERQKFPVIQNTPGSKQKNLNFSTPFMTCESKATNGSSLNKKKQIRITNYDFERNNSISKDNIINGNKFITMSARQWKERKDGIEIGNFDIPFVNNIKSKAKIE